MFCEADYLTEKRNAALETLGARYLFHPANRVERKDKEAREANAHRMFRKPQHDMTAADLIAYYKLQPPAMQGALRAFWRTLVSVPHTGRIFDEALAHLHHEEKHGG